MEMSCRRSAAEFPVGNVPAQFRAGGIESERCSSSLIAGYRGVLLSATEICRELKARSQHDLAPDLTPRVCRSVKVDIELPGKEGLDQCRCQWLDCV